MGEIGEIGRMISSLFLLLAGMVVVAIIARRFLPLNSRRGRREGPLRHLGMLTLTPQCSVALVQAGQDTLVLGLTPHSVTLLTKTGEPIQEKTIDTQGAENVEVKRRLNFPMITPLSRSYLAPYSRQEGVE